MAIGAEPNAGPRNAVDPMGVGEAVVGAVRGGAIDPAIDGRAVDPELVGGTDDAESGSDAGGCRGEGGVGATAGTAVRLWAIETEAAGATGDVGEAARGGAGVGAEIGDGGAGVEVGGLGVGGAGVRTDSG